MESGRWRDGRRKKKKLHICLGTMSVPTCELVGLKKEADLAASAVKWFSGLTVADATDSPAPLGACKFSQAWLLSKYTYRLPLRCRIEEKKKQTITQQGRRERSEESLHACEKKNWFCRNRLDNYGSSIQ